MLYRFPFNANSIWFVNEFPFSLFCKASYYWLVIYQEMFLKSIPSNSGKELNEFTCYKAISSILDEKLIPIILSQRSQLISSLK